MADYFSCLDCTVSMGKYKASYLVAMQTDLYEELYGGSLQTLDKLLEAGRGKGISRRGPRLTWTPNQELDLSQQRSVYLTLELKHCFRHYRCIKFRSALDKLGNLFKLNAFKITT